MKRFLLLLAILPLLLLSTNISAATNTGISVNNAYYKGDGKYDIVVQSKGKDSLKIYVNDEDSESAKVNKEGWATFKKVKLSGLSKLSFAKKVGWFKYYPVNHVKFIAVDKEKVTLSDTGPKQVYKKFYEWAITKLDFQVGDLSSSNYKTYSESRWKNINSQCDFNGTYDDGERAVFWDKNCLADKYKDYIDPSAFNYGSTVENSSSCPTSDAQYYVWICSRFGDMLTHIKASQQTSEDSLRDEEMDKAKVIYNEISLKTKRN